MDVFRQRLEDEHDANVIITAPTVPYQSACSSSLSLVPAALGHPCAELSTGTCAPGVPATPVVHRDGSTSLVSNPTDFPDPLDFASGGRAKAVLEPIVKATIIVPESASFELFAFPLR